MNVIEMNIPGCFELIPNIYNDHRGSFVKTFQYDLYLNNGLEPDMKEEFYSISQKGVIRGLHFQVPPFEQVKIVSCIRGRIMDVILDLRVGSPTYLKHQIIDLIDSSGKLIYISPGIAHGFLTLSEESIVTYKTSTIYSPEHDTGVRWDSADIPWGVTSPIISERDLSFSALSEYRSPFTFEKGEK